MKTKLRISKLNHLVSKPEQTVAQNEVRWPLALHLSSFNQTDRTFSLEREEVVILGLLVSPAVFFLGMC